LLTGAAFATVFVARVASAQDDAAVRACLLLRSPAECGLVNDEPFYAPGDSQNLRVLRPKPAVSEARRQAPDSPDRFTPLRGSAAGETVYERTRQLFTLPLRWQPWRLLSVGAEVPFVAQALATSTVYGVGDASIDLSAYARWRNLSGSVDAVLKAPTGDRAKGTGSDHYDASSMAQGWLFSGPLAVSVAGAYRYDGALLAHHLLQESVSAAYDLHIYGATGLGIEARVFGHERLGGSNPTRTSVHVALGLQPEVLGIAVGYLYLLAPLSQDAERSGWVLHGGAMVPFGGSPPTK